MVELSEYETERIFVKGCESGFDILSITADFYDDEDLSGLIEESQSLIICEKAEIDLGVGDEDEKYVKKLIEQETKRLIKKYNKQ